MPGHLYVRLALVASLWVAFGLGALASPRLATAEAVEGWSRQSPYPTHTDLTGVAFATSGHGFVVGQEGILAETIDAGASWALRVGDSGGTYYDIQFLDASRGWIVGNVTDGGSDHLRTVDGGATWTPMPNDLYGSWRVIDFVSASTGFAGLNGALGRTDDGGTTWTPLAVYPNAPVVYGMDFWDAQVGLVAGPLPDGPNGIRRTTDGGRTWTLVHTGAVNDVAFLTATVAVAAQADRLLRSTDGGRTWTALAEPTETHSGFGKVARASDTSAVAVTLTGDIWRTVDGGQTWRRELQGIGVFPAVWDASFRTAADGWVVGPEGIVLRTADGGATWSYASNGVGAHLADIRMASESFGLAVGEHGHVLRTADGGRHWQPSRLKVTGTIFGREEHLEAVTFVDPQFAVAAGPGGIVFTTADGGLSWQSIGYPALPGLLWIYDVEFTSRSDGWVVGRDDDLGHTRNVYRTTDGGATWTLVPLDMPVVFTAVDFADASHGWIVGPRGTLLRTDDGTNWQPVTIPGGGTSNLFMTDVGFADQTTGWAVGTLGYVIRSTDGGRTWQQQDPGTTEDFSGIHVVSPQEAWASTLAGSVLHTTDGGRTWTRASTGYTDGIEAISAVGGKVWVAGFNGTILANEVPPGQVVLRSLEFDPTTVAGGQSSHGTVTLSGPAPPGGLVVALTGGSGVVSLPSSITVPAGATSASFTAQTTRVTADMGPTITASASGSVSVSAELTVLTMLRSIEVSPTSIVGGTNGTGTVKLAAPAPTGGAVVELGSGANYVATFPTSVTIPAGATTASFTIGTKPVSSSEWVGLIATYDDVTRNTMFEVKPAPDTIAVTLAEYRRGKKEIRIEATSTSASATLDAYVTASGLHIGRLSSLGGGRYGGRFSWPTNPQSVTVTSSLGGSGTRTVAVR